MNIVDKYGHTNKSKNKDEKVWHMVGHLLFTLPPSKVRGLSQRVKEGGFPPCFGHRGSGCTHSYPKKCPAYLAIGTEQELVKQGQNGKCGSVGLWMRGDLGRFLSVDSQSYRK